MKNVGTTIFYITFVITCHVMSYEWWRKNCGGTVVRLVVRHGGEISECVGWIFGLQFCFVGWLFLVDGCGFALFFCFLFSSCSGLDQPSTNAWLVDMNVIGECVAEIWWKRKVAEVLFLQWLVVLWWLVVILVDDCGYVLVFLFFFSPYRGLWLP